MCVIACLALCGSPASLAIEPAAIPDAINAGAAKSGTDELAYTTVLSLLQVMEQKGLVDHRREGKAYVYLPLVERQGEGALVPLPLGEVR